MTFLILKSVEIKPMATILNGKEVALFYKQAIKEKVSQQLQKNVAPPGLAVILVGNDPASAIYVNHKRKACEECQFYSKVYTLEYDSSEQTVLDLIETLNKSPNIHGILVQLPLPAHINTQKIIESINPKKDVDGFHPYNLGLLAQGKPNLRPCTPFGIMTLLQHYEMNVHGKHAVVIGASNIVGRPMALELLNQKATVTICNSATPHLQSHVEQAEILIVATGIIDLVNPAWLQPKQVVIDVGIHRLENGKIRGDVDFNQAKERVGWITPVPFGVGPMTICMLLENTLQAQKTLTL